MKYIVLLLLSIFSGGIFPSCEKHNDNAPAEEANSLPVAASPVTSTFFATAFIEQKGSYDTPSDGDLWPSAWSDDDYLYAANGDGKGFDLNSAWADIVMNRISGHPNDRNITGERIASGNQMGQIWGDINYFNRKPTGMVSVGGDLYLAVQDLVKTGPHIFNEAPSATIVRSADKGKTWTWDNRTPMFKDHVFTTIFFLDYGKDGQNNTFDEYVYAYGLDNNWRDSFSNIVPDPTRLYLARIPKDGLQDVNTWEFYTGGLEGDEAWSAPGDISARKPVLEDGRRRYEKTIVPVSPNRLSVMSQGGVVYNKPLNRYIYTSWTEFTFEFYESPTPWGPWELFLSKDFGGYPWSEENFGGYATVIPSKFISSDGREMWVSSSTFVGGVAHYNFSLRRLWVTPYEESTPENLRSANNLAQQETFLEVTPITTASIRHGKLTALNDGDKDLSSGIDSYNMDSKNYDFWGYTWPRTYHINQLIYTTGDVDDAQGGWFRDIKVQLRKNFEWIDVKNLRIDPAYTFDNQVKPHTAYTLSFDEDWGDGIRIIGRPGGSMYYTSIAELEVYYR